MINALRILYIFVGAGEVVSSHRKNISEEEKSLVSLSFSRVWRMLRIGA